jgi:hypothetical protein
MPVTPETGNYLLLGLAAVAAISLLYAGSLAVRLRNLRQDLRLIEEIGQEEA